MERVILIILSIITLVAVPAIGLYYLQSSSTSPIVVNQNASDTSEEELLPRDHLPNLDHTTSLPPLSFNQTNTKPNTFVHGGSKLTCKANAQISARVVAITVHGSFKDVLSSKDAMPVDLGIVWGSHARNLPSDMSIRHGRPMTGFNGKNVWLYWEYSSKSRTIAKELEKDIANIHVIPGSVEIMNALKSIKKGDEVFLSGCLADLEVEGKKYRTSLVREDSGGGACEILFLKEFEKTS